MTAAMFIEHTYIEFNEMREGTGYRINWIKCKICQKELMRFIEYYQIQGNSRKTYSVDVVNIDWCDHHAVVKSQTKPDLYEFKVNDYYIVPR